MLSMFVGGLVCEKIAPEDGHAAHLETMPRAMSSLEVSKA